MTDFDREVLIYSLMGAISRQSHRLWTRQGDMWLTNTWRDMAIAALAEIEKQYKLMPK